MTIMEKDFKDRRTEISWPDDFRPENADLFAHNEISIKGTCEQVWQTIIEAAKWPEWTTLIKTFEITEGGDQLRADSNFKWLTATGLPVIGKVITFQPPHLITWKGAQPDKEPSFYHIWLIENMGGDQCRFTYEELGIGIWAKHLAAGGNGRLHENHDQMLAALKQAVEQ
jgi:uncharacterized protein YndB with AHSA1/START domain